MLFWKCRHELTFAVIAMAVEQFDFCGGQSPNAQEIIGDSGII